MLHAMAGSVILVYSLDGMKDGECKLSREAADTMGWKTLKGGSKYSVL